MSRMIRILVLTIVALIITACSGFYVKVIDQNGIPVPDVNIRVGVLTNLFLVSGGTTEFYKTDKDGRFTLSGPRVGIRLIEKNGYEFSREKGFGSISIYSHYDTNSNIKLEQKDNTYSNPYYILAWKRKEPEKLIGKTNYHGFILHSNDNYLPIIFTSKDLLRKNYVELKYTNNIKAHLLIKYIESNKIVLNRFKEKRHPWELKILVPHGRLIETHDIIRNRAPINGYKGNWSIHSDELTDIDSTLIKKFYFKTDDNSKYGQFTFEFISQFRDISFKSFWLNPDDSRNLTRPKKYVYCKPREFVPENCSIDDFGP